MSRSAQLTGGLLAAVGGVAIAVQGRVNGTLAQSLQNGFLAALISFGGGWLVLVVVVLSRQSGRDGLARLRESLVSRRIRWWECVGGLSGAFLVASQGIAIATIGVAVFTVAVVVGQVVSSLVVDRSGMGPGEPKPFTVTRGLGAAVGVVAVVVAVSHRFTSPGSLWLAVLPLVAGLLMGWQQAVNGLVREAAGHSVTTILVNFTTGTAALLLVNLVAARRVAEFPAQWWLYLGGLLGIVGVGGAIVSVRFIGVLMVGLCAVCGQLVGAVLLDAFSGHLALPTVIGVVLTLVSVGVAALPSGKMRP
ncbi:transporter family-2 protein [Lentzea atacamensis]|uniref:Transporter family-2 protein n=1 Tax=Lentzea atacamensis TaxID=531938 RepID=A0ABX9EEF9_9PSEU|nr:DMT family transporter [Lentzea atacamensis]RAS68850.1 transporter family-2 protein [Lentzea atacamensis]